jgi:hypothetical protein
MKIRQRIGEKGRLYESPRERKGDFDASAETKPDGFAYSPSGFRIAKYRRVSGQKRIQAIPAKIAR